MHTYLEESPLNATDLTSDFRNAQECSVKRIMVPGIAAHTLCIMINPVTKKIIHTSGPLGKSNAVVSMINCCISGIHYEAHHSLKLYTANVLH